MSRAAKELAVLIADAAVRRQRGESVTTRPTQAGRLVMELGADPDGQGVEEFFSALALELRARKTRLPPIEQLPQSVQPLILAAMASFEVGADGEIDYEATADRLDATLRKTFGTSPRQIREENFRSKIRDDIAASVAESMRRHGLTPARDLPDTLDDDESEE